MQNVALFPIPLEALEERVSNLVDKKVQALLSNLQTSKLEPVELLTRKQTAKLLGISLPTLNEWTKTGKVKGYRIGSRIRYKRAELEASLSKIMTRRAA